MLDLLKSVGWFLLTMILTFIFLALSYIIVMKKIVYKRLINRARVYLANNGRGNFENENEFVTGIDIIYRMICIGVMAVLGIILGALLVPPDRFLIVAVVISAGIFAICCAQLEMCFAMRIGRLKSVNEKEQCAFFVNLKNEEFSYKYDSPKIREKLIENRKYIVADYLFFEDVKPVDQYEWG